MTDGVECQVTKSRRGKNPRRRLKTGPRGTKGKDSLKQDAELAEADADGLKTPMSFVRVSPIHTAGWLDESAEIETLALGHDEGR